MIICVLYHLNLNKELAMEKIKINKIRCKRCGDVIESKTLHDFKFCK